MKEMTYDQRWAAKLKLARKCVQCQAGLLEHETTSRCDDCKERNKKHSSKKKVQRRYAKWARAKYWRDPEKHRKAQADKRLKKQLAGECRNCRRDALPDSDWCRTHRHKHRANSRRAMQKLRARRAAEKTR